VYNISSLNVLEYGSGNSTWHVSFEGSVVMDVELPAVNFGVVLDKMVKNNYDD
jgi:hypothetical protein